MLEDLVVLAGSRDDTIARTASDLVADLYGADALAEVDEELATATGASAEHLEALRARLTASEATSAPAP